MYVVKSGDYLAGISTALGVKLPDLLTLNNMTAASAIHPGDNLKVPVGGTIPVEPTLAPTQSAETPSPELSYTVAAGDYLGKIAVKLGVTLESLLTTNGMTAASLIVPGGRIKVPDGGTLPAPSSTANSVPAVALAAPVATYVVQPGDYLIDIAAKNGVTLKALLSSNALVASSVIVPSRVLALPPPTLPIAPLVAPPIVPLASPAAPTVASGGSTQPTPVDTLVSFLDAQLGKPYEFNKAGPDSYDCSGLVRAAYLQIGISLPHQSLLQSRTGSPVNWSTDGIRAGDLVFAFSTGKNYISHVGVAISSTQWISSSQSGVPVKIGSLPNEDKIQAVRRIVPG